MENFITQGQGRRTFSKFCFQMRELLMSRISTHGELKDNYPRKQPALDSLFNRLDAYVATGNTQHLVDAASLAYIESTYPSHPLAHFAPPTDANEGYTCFVCNKKIKGNHLMKVGDEWIHSVGVGSPPPSAIVHLCNKKCLKRFKRRGERK
jgi:hypothetical protein